MRAFISINIDNDTRKKIFEIQKEVKGKVAEINREFLDAIKWETSDKFHMTLFFLGEVSEAKLILLTNELNKFSENFETEIISFSAKGINAFPKLRFPRVLILELENPDKKVFELSEKINDVCKKIGFISDKKFHPHITLGRVRRDKKINLTELAGKIKTDLSFSVNGFYLMESKLRSSGSEYHIIREYKFKPK